MHRACVLVSPHARRYGCVLKSGSWFWACCRSRRSRHAMTADRTHRSCGPKANHACTMMSACRCWPVVPREVIRRSAARGQWARANGAIRRGEGGIAAWECAEGLGCATAFNSENGGNCRPWAQEGEACGGDPAMVLPLCESTLYCADATGASTHLTGTCVPRLAIGEQCYRARYWHAPCLNAALCPQDDDAGVCPAP